MFAALMLFAAATGQVVAADGASGVVRISGSVSAGDVLRVKRLEAVPGPPGRAPFMRWGKTATARVVAVRPDGLVEVAFARGRVGAGDRVVAD